MLLSEISLGSCHRIKVDVKSRDCYHIDTPYSVH